MDLEDQPEFFVLSATFQEGFLNIQYVESRDTSEHVGVQKNIGIDVRYIEDKVEELQDFLRDVVDEGLLMLRRPPKKISPTREARDMLDAFEHDGGT